MCDLKHDQFDHIKKFVKLTRPIRSALNFDQSSLKICLWCVAVAVAVAVTVTTKVREKLDRRILFYNKLT